MTLPVAAIIGRPNVGKSKRLNAGGLIVLTWGLLLSSWGHAHSYAIYISTPITPPAEFVWWLPFSAILLLCSLLWLLRKSICVGWKKSLWLSLVIFVVFGVSFFLFGMFAAGASTAPLPGLGPPCRVFWGFGWAYAGKMFIFWNVLGVIFLMCSFFIVTKTWRIPKKWKPIGLLTLAYVVCLLPYLVSGALVHGWTGGYVSMGCGQRLRILNDALFKYAENHDKNWPQAVSFEELMEQLTPYIAHDYFPYNQFPLAVCPAGAAFEKNPKPYIWNIDFSGKSMDDFTWVEAVADSSPFTCPYCRYSATFFQLTRYLQSKENKISSTEEQIHVDTEAR